MKKLITLLFPILLASCSMHGVYNNAEKYVAGPQTYEGEIKTLNVNWTAGSVTLVENYEVNDIKIEEENDLAEAEKVYTYFHDGILDVQYCASGYVGNIDSSKKNLIITYKPTVEKYNISLTSGTFYSYCIHADSFNLSYTSGKATVEHLEAKNANVSYTSGSLSTNDIKAEKFDVSFTSGSLTCNYTSIKESHISATSGYIVVNVPEDGGKVHVSHTSGKTNTHREGTYNDGVYTFGSGSAEIYLNLTSGTIELY